MGTATVVRGEASDLCEKRDAILARVNMTVDELESRARESLLTASESVAWRRIEAINWFLNE